jgi:hypothetical protein
MDKDLVECAVDARLFFEGAEVRMGSNVIATIG